MHMEKILSPDKTDRLSLPVFEAAGVSIKFTVIKTRWRWHRQTVATGYWSSQIRRFRCANTFRTTYQILLVLGISCWLLAWRIASPLQSMVNTLDRFGHGDLTARVNSHRHDEIGKLGAAFDRMAERIGTLLTSQRRLLEDVSHELRSPLARLSFAAELAGTADNRGAAVTRLKKEIQRLTDLVDALLQTMQAEGEPHAISQEDVELSTLLSEIVEDCKVEAEACECSVALHGQATTIQGERELLRRAVENIVRNGIRYSPEASTIDVAFGADDHAAYIFIRDYGPGVPQDSLNKIFEPFFRVDDSRNRSTGGVGLGLAIAHRSIISHDGVSGRRTPIPVCS
jgi:two-component system, OmpR family, sensor histidine kinase CpxA